MQIKAKKMGTAIKADVICGIVITLFAILVYILSFFVKSYSIATVGPGFMPRVVAVILFLLGFALIIQTLFRIRLDESVTNDINVSPDALERKRVWSLSYIIEENANILSIPLLAFYAFSLKSLGFIVSSSIYLFLQMNLLEKKGERTPLIYAIVSVIIPLLVYFVFNKYFYLMLPEGILG